MVHICGKDWKVREVSRMSRATFPCDALKKEPGPGTPTSWATALMASLTGAHIVTYTKDSIEGGMRVNTRLLSAAPKGLQPRNCMVDQTQTSHYPKWITSSKPCLNSGGMFLLWLLAAKIYFYEWHSTIQVSSYLFDFSVQHSAVGKTITRCTRR